MSKKRQEKREWGEKRERGERERKEGRKEEVKMREFLRN